MASVATKIFQELVEGVFYIHNMGIVHRDLKVSGGDSVIDSCLLGCLGCQFIELNETVYFCSFTSEVIITFILHKASFHRSGT